MVADVPPGVVTVTSTVPGRPAGEVAVIGVARVDGEAAWPAVAPNVTAVAPVKSVPVMVTGCRRRSGRRSGLTAVTVGAAS